MAHSKVTIFVLREDVRTCGAEPRGAMRELWLPVGWRGNRLNSLHFEAGVWRQSVVVYKLHNLR